MADFKEVILCDQKRKYAIISFAFWSPKTAAKSLKTTLAVTRKINNDLGNWKWELMYTFLSFEGGGALPEDTSREGCGVGTPETRRGAGR